MCFSPHCGWPRREFHPDLLPGHISALRRPAAPVQGPPSATPEMVRDVAVHLVLHDLEPVRAVERVGFRAFLVKHATAAPTRRPRSCPGLASARASRPRRSAAPRPRYPRALAPRRPAPGLRSSSGAAVQGALDTVLGDIGRQVAELVSAAKDSGCRFVIQGDTWKPRKRGGGGAALTGSLPVPARLGIPEASPSQARVQRMARGAPSVLSTRRAEAHTSSPSCSPGAPPTGPFRRSVPSSRRDCFESAAFRATPRDPACCLALGETSPASSGGRGGTSAATDSCHIARCRQGTRGVVGMLSSRGSLTQAMPAPRTGEAYADAFRKALAQVGLVEADVLAGVSDHEGAVRKGLRPLQAPCAGPGRPPLAWFRKSPRCGDSSRFFRGPGRPTSGALGFERPRPQKFRRRSWGAAATPCSWPPSTSSRCARTARRRGPRRTPRRRRPAHLRRPLRGVAPGLPPRSVRS